MTQRAHPQVDAGRGPVSGWAVGLAVFAGCMMIMAGLFGAITGIAAIVDDDLYVIRGDYVFEWDVTAWGWIHLVLGIIVIAAGIAVFTGRAWARVVGIALAVLSAVANFMFLPYYPVWSIVIIALDVAVIWALARYSRQAAAETWG
ncbi:hypothetical protein ACH35V_19890 [Actinomadura sp. 1N219]|uniref:DUF7144 family membrane protein n=1 Tax=Actinomadura sp. 1N219 TaxID=3375152 RepID=UPI0037B8677F